MIPKQSKKVNPEQIVDYALDSFDEPEYTQRWRLPFQTAQRLKGAYYDLTGQIPKTLPEPLKQYILDNPCRFEMPPEMDADGFTLAVYMDWDKVKNPHGHNSFTLAAKQSETSGITYFLPPSLFPIPRIQERAQKLINVLYCLALNSPNGEFYITSRTAAQFLDIDQKTALRIINYLSQYQIIHKTRFTRIGKGLVYFYKFSRQNTESIFSQK
jgi:hypothetical protein